MGCPSIMHLIRYLAIAVLDRLFSDKRIHYRGNFVSWDKASAACEGYGVHSILDKVRVATQAVLEGRAAFERDSILFHEPEYNWPLLALLFRLQTKTPGAVTVLDFGGSLGSTYHQHRKWLDEIPGLRWCVVEQPHFAACGKKEFETERLKFYASLDECMKVERITLALFSCVLSYLPDPWATLKIVAQADIPCVMIDQTLVWAEGKNGERFVVQYVPETIYRASYPARIFAAEQFSFVLGRKYRLVASFAGYEHPVVLSRPWQIARYRAFILENQG